MTELIPISDIDLNASIQVRSETDGKAIHEYGLHWSNGGEFPPVILYRIEGKLLLADGWHRVRAVQRAVPRKALIDILGDNDEEESGRKIEAEIREGTYDDYLEAAMAANAAHGVRLTNLDKRRIVELALKQWPGRPTREIADKVKVVSHELVNTVRNEIDEAAKARAAARKAAKDRKAKGEASGDSDPKLEYVRKMPKSVQAAYKAMPAGARKSVSVWEIDALKQYKADEAVEILEEIGADPKAQLTISAARSKILQRRIDAAFKYRQGSHGVLVLTSETDWRAARAVVAPKAELILHLVGATKREWREDASLGRKDRIGPWYFVGEHLVGPFLADATSRPGGAFSRIDLLNRGGEIRGLAVQVAEPYSRKVESTHLVTVDMTLEDHLSDLILAHKDQGPILDLSGTSKVAALVKHHGGVLWSLCETEAQATLVREALGLVEEGESKPKPLKKPSLAKAAKGAKGKAPDPEPVPEAPEAAAEVPEALSA